MANRLYPSQFLYSFTRMPVAIMGGISIVQQVKAVKVTQGLTLTAVAFGTSGNSITIAFTPGATAGAEVVTVVGNAISVQIETGVSSVTQVRTALQAAAPATALVVTTGTNASTVVTASALPLLGGVDGVVAGQTIPGVASMSQTGVGEFTITLTDVYNALVFPGFSILKAAAQDLVPQVKSQTVASTKIIVVNLLTGATPTDPTAAMTLYMKVLLRNSSVSV